MGMLAKNGDWEAENCKTLSNQHKSASSACSVHVRITTWMQPFAGAQRTRYSWQGISKEATQLYSPLRKSQPSCREPHKQTHGTAASAALVPGKHYWGHFCVHQSFATQVEPAAFWAHPIHSSRLTMLGRDTRHCSSRCKLSRWDDIQDCRGQTAPDCCFGILRNPSCSHGLQYPCV